MDKNSEIRRNPAMGSILQAGLALEKARGAAILVHGRGASAESMLPLSEALEIHDLAYLFPQAPGGSWYPYSFLSPFEKNEPYLSAALKTLNLLFTDLHGAGFAPERVLLVGFSQGACLSLEFAARNPQRYGGIAALSGGLIGPSGSDLTHTGSLTDTPVFIGCSDIDPHIPKSRVLESEQVLKMMGAKVTAKIYPGMGHTINEDELERVREMARDL